MFTVRQHCFVCGDFTSCQPLRDDISGQLRTCRRATDDARQLKEDHRVLFRLSESPSLVFASAARSVSQPLLPSDMSKDPVRGQ